MSDALIPRQPDATPAVYDAATLVGDEDQLGVLQRVHADSLTSLPSRK